MPKNQAKNNAPKRRNTVVQAMIARSANAGLHKDKKKEQSRKACRVTVREDT
jgi:hypothetical protein